MPGKEGLLHISEIDWRRFETMEETGIKEGDKIKVTYTIKYFKTFWLTADGVN